MPVILKNTGLLVSGDRLRAKRAVSLSFLLTVILRSFDGPAAALGAAGNANASGVAVCEAKGLSVSAL